MSKVFEGRLEIDDHRGVIYFHLSREEDIIEHNLVSLLRICRLPKITNLDKGLDITHMVGCSWEEKNES